MQDDTQVFGGAIRADWYRAICGCGWSDSTIDGADHGACLVVADDLARDHLRESPWCGENGRSPRLEFASIINVPR
jgi:hypothetical protein